MQTRAATLIFSDVMELNMLLNKITGGPKEMSWLSN